MIRKMKIINQPRIQALVQCAELSLCLQLSVFFCWHSLTQHNRLSIQRLVGLNRLQWYSIGTHVQRIRIFRTFLRVFGVPGKRHKVFALVDHAWCFCNRQVYKQWLEVVQCLRHIGKQDCCIQRLDRCIQGC